MSYEQSQSSSRYALKKYAFLLCIAALMACLLVVMLVNAVFETDLEKITTEGLFKFLVGLYFANLIMRFLYDTYVKLKRGIKSQEDWVLSVSNGKLKFRSPDLTLCRGFQVNISEIDCISKIVEPSVDFKAVVYWDIELKNAKKIKIREDIPFDMDELREYLISEGTIKTRNYELKDGKYVLTKE